MKFLITAFCFLTFALGVKAQVIEYFVANENSNDTLACLRYFKNIDKAVAQKLDSFFKFAKTAKDKDSDGFIEFSMFRDNSKKIIADISINSQYADYRIFAGITSINYDLGKVFAFTWYKSKLVLFTLDASLKFKIKYEYKSILHDLMYPEMSKSVRNEIDKKVEEYSLEAPGIVKRYYLD